MKRTKSTVDKVHAVHDEFHSHEVALQAEQDKLDAEKAKKKQELEEKEWSQYTHSEAQIGLVPLKKKKTQRVVLMPSKSLLLYLQRLPHSLA